MAVAAMAPIIAATKRQSNLGAALEDDWKRKHEFIMKAGCKPIEQDASDKKRKTWKDLPKCWKTGFHLCNDAGLLIAHFRDRFLNVISITCKPKIGREKFASAVRSCAETYR